MSQTYTEAYALTAGVTLGCMALHNPTASTITAVVVPWRNSTNGGAGGVTAAVAVPPGGILPLKTRQVVSGTGLIGLN